MKYSNYFKEYNKSIYDLLNNFDTSLIDKSVELILDCKKIMVKSILWEMEEAHLLQAMLVWILLK